MLGKIIVVSTIAASILLLLVLQITNPSTAGPLGLLAVFFLLYIVILGCMTEVLLLGSYLLSVVGRRLMTKRPPKRLSLAKSYYFSTVLSLGPIIALAMQSIGSLHLYELALITIFLVIGILYVAKRSSH